MADRLDESIIGLKNSRPENKINIHNGVYLSNEFVEFDRKQILGGKLSIMLPTSFEIMALEYAKMKYPSEDRPQEIWTSPDTATNFGISHLTQIDTDAEYLKEDTAEMKAILKKTNPAMEFYQENLEELEDFNIAWFDYKSFGIDHDMYNIMFLAPLGGKALHGVFICLYSDYSQWSEVARQMLRSIELVKQ